jgi:glutamyl-tRNA reductase
MSLVVVGLHHRTAPIDVLERVTIPPAGFAKALSHIRSGDDIAEAVIVSTCNRTEIYAVCETFHGALGQLHRFLTDSSGLPLDRIAPYLLTAYDDAVARHLFTVTSGLDSAVVGETEILGQVKTAFDVALAEQSTGPHLASLFRHALETGKRARTETAIARGTASVSHAAVELAADRLGSLTDRSVLVLGTGEIGVSMATALQNAGVGDVFVANRTRQKAASLASRIGATAVALQDLPAALERVDVLLTATSSDTSVLGRDDLVAVMAAREGRPLLVVDTGMPRDVEPSAASVDGVTLLDLDAIRAFVELGLDGRRREIDHVREIVGEEVDRYRAGASARLVAPVLVSMREHFETVRVAELDHVDARLAQLAPADRELVETITRRLVAKLAHTPTVRLKDAAGTIRGTRMADALRALFDLDGLDSDPDDASPQP